MARSKDIDAVAAAWFAKRDSGDWTEDDQLNFDGWLDADLAHRIAYLRIEVAWKHAEGLKRLNTVARRDAEAVSTPAGGREKSRPRSTYGRLIASAATILIVCAVMLGWVLLGGTPEEYHTPLGGVAKVPLTDGSTITLNTASQIRVALTERERKITLPHGEAYFDVAKDPDRPFTVEAGSSRVTAVGTKFSVWNEEDRLRVAVTEGHVLIEDSSLKGGGEIHLRAGDVASGSRGNLLIHRKPLDAIYERYLSWRDGFLVFNDTSLAEAVEEFNRYNTKKIRFEDPALGNLKIGGSFKPTNLGAFLRLLEQGLPIQTAHRDETVILLKSGDS